MLIQIALSITTAGGQLADLTETEEDRSNLWNRTVAEWIWSLKNLYKPKHSDSYYYAPAPTRPA